MSIRQVGYTDFHLDGAKELEGLLKEFPERIQRTVVDAATSAGAKLFKKEIKRNIKTRGLIDTGNLHDSIMTEKVRGVHGVYRIFASTQKGKKGYHAHLVEFGTATRKFKRPHFVNLRTGPIWTEHSGRMLARPFFRPALDEHKTDAMKKMALSLAKGLAREGKKMTQKWGTMSKSYRKKLAK